MRTSSYVNIIICKFPRQYCLFFFLILCIDAHFHSNEPAAVAAEHPFLAANFDLDTCQNVYIYQQRIATYPSTLQC